MRTDRVGFLYSSCFSGPVTISSDFNSAHCWGEVQTFIDVDLTRGKRLEDDSGSHLLGGHFKKSDKDNRRSEIGWKARFCWGFDITWRSDVE